MSSTVATDPGGLFASAVNHSAWARDARRTKAASREFTLFLEILVKHLRTGQELAGLSSSLHLGDQDLLKHAYALLSRWLFDDNNNHYQVLGLETGADIGSIKHRYRLLMGLFHPDKAPDWAMPQSSDVGRLHEAYRVLKSQASRQAYDRLIDTPDGEPPPIRTAARSAPTRSRDYGESWPDAVYRFELFQRHPKVGIWLLLFVVIGLLLLGVYLSSRQPALQATRILSIQPEPAAHADQALEKERQLIRQLGRN